MFQKSSAKNAVLIIRIKRRSRQIRFKTQSKCINFYCSAKEDLCAIVALTLAAVYRNLQFTHNPRILLTTLYESPGGNLTNDLSRRAQLLFSIYETTPRKRQIIRHPHMSSYQQLCIQNPPSCCNYRASRRIFHNCKDKLRTGDIRYD